MQLFWEFAMSKTKDPAAAEQTPDKADKSTAPTHYQDKFAGQGGSYVIDPVTNQRIKTEE
jgi:hypothetical protein